MVKEADLVGGLVSVSRTRCAVLTLRRRAGTQGHTHNTARWAPALQRTTPDDVSHRRGRCAASGARERRGTRALHVIARSPCDEAIQTASADGFLDCFRLRQGFGGQVAALAMTECDATASRFPHHLACRHALSLSRLNSPELCLITPPSRPRGRREGRVPARTRGPLRDMRTQEEPHSSIQVVPITRPSLRDGRTAYAVLSREPNFPLASLAPRIG
jgi:hypothetical protein